MLYFSSKNETWTRNFLYMRTSNFKSTHRRYYSDTGNFVKIKLCASLYTYHLYNIILKVHINEHTQYLDIYFKIFKVDYIMFFLIIYDV